MKQKYFTIDEARELLPQIQELIVKANRELDDKSMRLQELNRRYLKAELALDECQIPDDDDDENMDEFRQQRANFELAISELSREQAEFIRCLESWVDKVSSHGVILRKIKEGLIDFPAQNGEFKYFLCWQLGEHDITHWHLADDGFIGRKALVTLSEYC